MSEVGVKDKGKSMIMILIVVLIVIMSITLGMVVYFFNTFKSVQTSKTATEKSTTESHVKKEEVEVENIHVIKFEDPIMTNLSENHIIKFSVGIGMDSTSKDYKKLSKHLEENDIMIKNIVIESITGKTFEAMKQVDAKQKLKKEILEKANKYFKTEMFKEVYIGEYYIQ